MKKTVRRPGFSVSDNIPWAGHLPATRVALEAILTRAASGIVQSSLHARVLAGICEFRAMTANGALGTFLRTSSVRKLSEARFALNEIGAMDVASLLSDTISGLQRTSSRRREATLLLRLERDLIAVGPHLDEIIAQYAVKTHRRSAPRRPVQIGDQ